MPQFMRHRCHRGHPLAHRFPAEFLSADEAQEEGRATAVLTVDGTAAAVLLDTAAYQRTTGIRSRVYAGAPGRPEKVKGDWRTTRWANSSGKAEDYGWPTGLSSARK